MKNLANQVDADFILKAPFIAVGMEKHLMFDRCFFV